MLICSLSKLEPTEQVLKESLYWSGDTLMRFPGAQRKTGLSLRAECFARTYSNQGGESICQYESVR